MKIQVNKCLDEGRLETLRRELAALGKEERVIADFSGVGKPDIRCLQLLLAFRKQAGVPEAVQIVGDGEMPARWLEGVGLAGVFATAADAPAS